MASSHNRVEVLHGVNFDMLGSRDPLHYGGLTLPELELKIKGFANELGLEATFFQTNHEGEYVEHLHRLPEMADAAILNPGAWTHYSWAIRDALEFIGRARRSRSTSPTSRSARSSARSRSSRASTP